MSDRHDRVLALQFYDRLSLKAAEAIVDGEIADEIAAGVERVRRRDQRWVDRIEALWPVMPNRVRRWAFMHDGRTPSLRARLTAKAPH